MTEPPTRFAALFVHGFQPVTAGSVAAMRFLIALSAIIFIRIGSTRLMNRYPTNAIVLIAIYATGTIAVALIIAFLLMESVPID